MWRLVSSGVCALVTRLSRQRYELSRDVRTVSVSQAGGRTMYALLLQGLDFRLSPDHVRAFFGEGADRAAELRSIAWVRPCTSSCLL